MHLMRTWVCRVINYKSFPNSAFISLTRDLQHILQICVTPFGLTLLAASLEYLRLPFTFISTFPPYLMGKCICFDTFRNTPNSFSALVFIRNWISIIYERKRLIFNRGYVLLQKNKAMIERSFEECGITTTNSGLFCSDGLFKKNNG